MQLIHNLPFEHTLSCQDNQSEQIKYDMLWSDIPTDLFGDKFTFCINNNN
jgi:hypothetical protein